MSEIFVIGISEPQLSKAQRTLLSQCDLVVGTNRFFKLCNDCTPRFQPIAPLAEAITAIRSALTKGNVAVLASGDPLYYGIGKKLLNEFSAEKILFYPALSSLQKACALFKTPWNDAAIISLHGRSNLHIAGLILPHRKSLVFTDKTNSPSGIAAKIIEYLRLIDAPELIDSIKIYVAEDLGMESEKVSFGSLTAISQQSYSALNILCFERPEKSTGTFAYPFGLSEDDVCHSRGLITKNEVRAATLHQLRLRQDGVLWDIGAGSGSISLEAARLTPGLTAYAVEHKEEEIYNIKKNILKFGCYNIVPVFGRAPDNLNSLPAPDSVFIGGSSGSLPEIVAYAAKKLQPGGRLVINGVIAKTIEQAPVLMAEHGLSVTSSVLRVTRTESDGTIREFNPITILTGTK